MNVQITLAATMLIASGHEDHRLGHGLVAHAIDEDGDEEPEAHGQGGQDDEPDQAVRSAMSDASLLKNQA